MLFAFLIWLWRTQDFHARVFPSKFRYKCDGPDEEYLQLMYVFNGSIFTKNHETELKNCRLLSRFLLNTVLEHSRENVGLVQFCWLWFVQLNVFGRHRCLRALNRSRFIKKGLQLLRKLQLTVLVHCTGQERPAGKRKLWFTLQNVFVLCTTRFKVFMSVVEKHDFLSNFDYLSNSEPFSEFCFVILDWFDSSKLYC
jgi:hypothetical protein